MYNQVQGTGTIVSKENNITDHEGVVSIVFANAYVTAYDEKEKKEVKAKMLLGLYLSENISGHTLIGDLVVFKGRLIGNEFGAPFVKFHDDKPWSYYAVHVYELKTLTHQDKEDFGNANDIVTIYMVGNLGKDAESRVTPAGHTVSNFNVAANRTVLVSEEDKKNGAKDIKETVWTRCTLWGKAAESSMNKLVKGQLVFIQGEFRFDINTGAPSLWSTKDGDIRGTYEVTVATHRILKSNGSTVAGSAPSFSEDEAIPF